MNRILSTLLLGLLVSTWSLAQSDWSDYKNDRFGYQIRVPNGLLVSNRAADGSGVTWQTGTVRVQTSGVNNPYKTKPHEHFGNLRSAAGDKIVSERGTFVKGSFPQTQAEKDALYWYEILYTKDGRRVHRKTFIASGAINTAEVSYGYRYREAKEGVGRRILETFIPGDLLQGH